MSTKELVIELRVPLPNGMIEESKAIASSESLQNAIRQHANAAFGDAYSLSIKTESKRPRKPKVEVATETAAQDAVQYNGAEEPRSSRRRSSEQAETEGATA